MIKEYVKLIWRHIRRRKGLAIINIGGFAVGLAACILAFFFIRDEFSFDRFHAYIDSIYEVKSVITYSGGPQVSLETQGPVAVTLAANFPEVEAATRLTATDLILQYGDKIFKQKGIGVDPSFFDVFSFPLVRGKAGSALQNPNSVVLSTKAARLLFGITDPMGQTVSIKIKDETSELEVTGIAQEIPANSSVKFDLLLPILQVKGSEIDQWNTGLDAACFIRLRKDTDPHELQAKFQGTIDKFLKKKGVTGNHYLFPFAEYHKGAKSYSFSSVLEPQSSPSHSYILSGIAFLVLLIAGFNFMNLSIAAAASGRMKEIGMRMVLGARRKQLLQQFRFEGIVMSLGSLVVGFGVAAAVLPVFNRFAGKELKLDLLGPVFPLVMLILFAIILGILAGSYPGWFLSQIRPIDLFKGKFLLGRRSRFNRSFLLFQLGFSIFLVIITGFLYRQHQYLLQADLGYKPDHVMVLNIENLTQNFQMSSQFLPVLKSRLLQYPEIKSVSGAYSDMPSSSAIIAKPEGTQNPEIIRFNTVDLDYIKTLGIRLSEGRWFSSEYTSDKTNAVVINEAFARRFNIKEPTKRSLSEFFRYRGPGSIIGVVKDFHFDSLRQPIQPAFFNLESDRFQKVYIQLEEGDLRKAIDLVKKEFAALAPGYPFLFSFLDDEVALQYEDEKRWSHMITIVSIFAVLIACSGIFALALEAVSRRTKEIGVRKVLGASVSRIFYLLTSEFMWIAAVAVAVTWPIAYLVMHKILSDYPYRISLNLWMFVAGGMVVILLTLAAISLHTVRAAIRNPVESLRDE